MNPTTIGPYGLPGLTPVQSNNSLDEFLFQPLQQNSSGTLPGTTVINVGNVIQVNGNQDYITVANPNTTIVQLVLGQLPDGSFGMVVSKSGINVLSLFS
jgi:hypothetical protein